MLHVTFSLNVTMCFSWHLASHTLHSHPFKEEDVLTCNCFRTGVALRSSLTCKAVFCGSSIIVDAYKYYATIALGVSCLVPWVIHVWAHRLVYCVSNIPLWTAGVNPLLRSTRMERSMYKDICLCNISNLFIHYIFPYEKHIFLTL